MRHMRRIVIVIFAALLAALASPGRAEPPPVAVYKSPSCGCCEKRVQHLRQNGYEVEVTNVSDLQVVKRKLAVPAGASSCHTAMVGPYYIEGHVPAQDVSRLLAEHPTDVAGLAVPGMPVGSPGMEGPNAQPYSVLAVKRDGKLSVFAEHRP